MVDRTECIFCRIVDGDLPADVVHVGQRVVAFRDIRPVAPTHVLVVTRQHHENVVELAGTDPDAMAELVHVGSQVASQADGGQFRLVFNTGAQVGQSVFHVHGHILAGRHFTWPPG
jgi:histidine triad (HIT) family protein